MKYVVIIPEGASDLPQHDLEGQTPLQAAFTPTFDWIAGEGKVGLVDTCSRRFGVDPGASLLSVLGVDPADCYTGFAPLEAAGLDIKTGPDDWVYRCNLVTIINGIMEDYCAGHISSTESATLIGAYRDSLSGTGIGVYNGRSYRNLLVIPGDLGVTTVAPETLVGEPIANFLPKGEGAQVLTTLMDRARELFAMSEINAVRADLGENVATDIWLWGQGQTPKLPAFSELFSVSAAIIADTDMPRGLGKLMGIASPVVNGATGYINTNYSAICDQAMLALDSHDLVIVHVQAPAEASLNADALGKTQAIEKIDQIIAAPLLERLKLYGENWRMMVLPTHSADSFSQQYTKAPVPFAIAGKRVETLLSGEFEEESAQESDLHVQNGHSMMEYLLTVR